MSCSTTVRSALPVASRYSSAGLNCTQLTSALCASVVLRGALSRRSQSMSFLSSPTEAKSVGLVLCHATSSTTPPCAVYVCIALITCSTALRG